MIKFFRKIRQNLLNEGKSARYFKFAIGEIILVKLAIYLISVLEKKYLAISNYKKQ